MSGGRGSWALRTSCPVPLRHFYNLDLPLFLLLLLAELRFKVSKLLHWELADLEPLGLEDASLEEGRLVVGLRRAVVGGAVPLHSSLK